MICFYNLLLFSMHPFDFFLAGLIKISIGKISGSSNLMLRFLLLNLGILIQNIKTKVLNHTSCMLGMKQLQST